MATICKVFPFPAWQTYPHTPCLALLTQLGQDTGLWLFEMIGRKTIGTPRDTREASGLSCERIPPCAGFTFPLGRSPTDLGTHHLAEGCPQWGEIDSGSPERMRQLYKEMNGKGGMTWGERSEQHCLFMGSDQGPGKSALLWNIKRNNLPTSPMGLPY